MRAYAGLPPVGAGVAARVAVDTENSKGRGKGKRKSSKDADTDAASLADRFERQQRDVVVAWDAAEAATATVAEAEASSFPWAAQTARFATSRI